MKDTWSAKWICIVFEDTKGNMHTGFKHGIQSFQEAEKWCKTFAGMIKVEFKEIDGIYERMWTRQYLGDEMKKYEVLLNFFSGFYESVHSEVFDSQEEDIIEDYPGHEYDDFRFKTDEIGYCKKYVSAISSEINLKMEFMDLTSPREYNFSTDKISVYIDGKTLKKISSVLNSDTLKNIIKRRFTSRDGFLSYYSSDIEEWKEKKVQDWNCVELGTLLDAWIIDSESRDYYDNLDWVGFEYYNENGQYVDYDILWDTEAEMQAEAEKTAELSKLEAWKSAVNGWKE